jgi:TolB-like protein/DNA-binding winged helix-turn-helix (wHTH) protein
VAAAVYEFGDFRLDSSRFELLREERGLRLERKPMELLLLLVEANGRLVTRAEIAERLWDKEVFVDTEHGINTAIRKIRQTLRDDSESPRFVQTVPGMGYRFIAPIAIQDTTAATPVVELPPVGLEDHQSLAPPEPIAALSPAPVRRTAHRQWFAAFAALILLAGVFVLVVGPHPVAARLLHPGDPAISSIAVLPLDNLSGDPSQNYFADGTTDELITMLAKDSSLRITSRTSVLQYKGARRPLPEIARELGVDAILEGSIARTSDRVHLNLQLIRADTDTHLWAESYDRSAAEVSALPSEAARDLADRLHKSVATPAIQHSINPEAHDAYLHGHYLWYANQNDMAGPYFRKATELQPDYAPGWSGLSTYYGAGVVDGLLDPRTALPLAEADALRSVQLDPTLPEAHLALCASVFIVHWNAVRSDPECLRAIQLDPGFAEPHHFRAKIFAALNRHPEAIEEQKRAMELDPFGRPWALAYSYLLARQYDAALSDARQRLEATPDDWGLHWVLYVTYRCKGMHKEATEELEKMLTLMGEGQSAAGIRHAWEQGGRRAVLHWQIASYQKESRTHYVSPMQFALLYAQIGDRERALSALEEEYRQHSPDLLWIQCDPAYDFLHDDPRYRVIVQHVRISLSN